MRYPILGALALIGAASVAPALADEPMTLTYEQFEFAVPHFDMEACPDGLAGEGTFCRVSFNTDMVHVFVFSDEGDQPLVGFRSYDQDSYTLTLE